MVKPDRKGLTMFGTPVEELSREQLIEALYVVNDLYNAHLDDKKRRFDFMQSLKKDKE